MILGFNSRTYFRRFHKVIVATHVKIAPTIGVISKLCFQIPDQEAKFIRLSFDVLIFSVAFIDP